MVPGFVAFFRRSLTRTRPERLEEGGMEILPLTQAHRPWATRSCGGVDGPLIASKGRLSTAAACRVSSRLSRGADGG